ncbi:hypothetical protein FGRMN_8483 [Fusarium graminum]|nr:hypothetical protein FGRMN_8483 [Fusarium graminum]
MPSPSKQDFSSRCANFEEYPGNFLSCRLGKSTRDTIKATWDRESKTTFNNRRGTALRIQEYDTFPSSYDYGLALFKDDNTLLSRPEHTLTLNHLGRSGREIRYSFLLRSVEASTSTPGRSWGIRQLALYHSFDVGTGQCFWLTCKGNSTIEDSINDALSNDPVFKPSAMKSVPDAFAATFDILAMILDWCDENWRWYINSMVDEVMDKADTAKTYKIADEQDFKELKRRVTHGGQIDITKRSRSSSVDLESGTRLQNLKKALSFKRSENITQSLSHIGGTVDELERLKLFSFQELQNLQEVLERIQEALLVLKLNHQVIKQIREHYQALMNQYKIPEMRSIQSSCRDLFLRSSCHSKSIEGSIETRQVQLNSLYQLVQENKALYESILQYKSFQTNKIYAETAQSSAYNMEIIANKTKQETTSMHVITFVTLIFLPATFMARGIRVSSLSDLPGSNQAAAGEFG